MNNSTSRTTCVFMLHHALDCFLIIYLNMEMFLKDDTCLCGGTLVASKLCVVVMDRVTINE